VDLVGWALETSQEKLATELPRRWEHVQGVERRSRSLDALVGNDADLLRAAALLHDVGYAPDLANTGFHPLDGAHYLLSQGAPRRLVDLVAHHSLAAVEARLRGLGQELEKFSDEGGVVRDALWYCDLTTSPSGHVVSAPDRLAEITDRYGPDHVVTRFVEEARSGLLTAVRRTEERLAAFV
jgi:putative nucleotidyltransferase with HDIG domain